MYQKTKLLTPKTDVVFHSLFRAGNENITKGIISDLIGEKIETIDLEQDRYLLKKYTEEKLGILDLKAKLNNGTICNIEVQLANLGDTVKRFLWYWSKIYSSQINKGDQYSKLERCISVLILDYELEDLKELKDKSNISELKEECHTKWKIIEEKRRKIILTNLLEIHIIEMPKAKRLLRKYPNDKIMQWMIFLDDPNNLEVSNIMKENENIKEAAEKLEEISSDKELRRIAELREKAIMDERSAIGYATRMGYEDGKEKGIKEGKKEGIKQGIKEGIKEANIENARKMKEKNIEISIIEEITGLTQEEIQKL